MEPLPNTSSWDIIFWDNCVDYVPSSWSNSNKTKYMWPTHLKSQAGIRDLISKCEPPTLKNGKWTEHSAEFKKTVLSLTTAEELVKKLQYTSGTSDLEGDTNNDGISIAGSTATVLNEFPDKSHCKDPLMTKILETVIDIKLQQQKLQNEVLEIKHLFQRLIVNDPVMTSLTESKFQFPLCDDTDVTSLETMLAAETDNITKLAHELYIVGGETIQKAVLNIIKKLFKKELSLKYSSRGKKGKRNFSQLKLCSAVILAVRRRFPNSSELDIMKSIGSVLATAADRDGGRKQRQTATAEVTELIV